MDTGITLEGVLEGIAFKAFEEFLFLKGSVQAVFLLLKADGVEDPGSRFSFFRTFLAR